MAASKCPSILLSNGLSMPSVGLGTWLSDDEPELTAALETALESGYRHFDTAWIYFNEAVIGKTLRKWLDSGKIKREELFIVTKLPICGMRQDKVAHFLEKSLTSLQLDYVDLYLIHTPFGVDSKSDADPVPMKDGEVIIDPNTDLIAVWRGMEAVVQQGKAKAIGLSNFDGKQIQRIVDAAKIRPACLQLEMHIFFQQHALRAICAKNDIVVCAYSPLGAPGIGKVYDRVKQTFTPAGLLSDPVITRIAKKHNKTSAQVCLKFLVQQGIIVIPKSTSGQRLKENLQLFDFQLDLEEIKELEKLDKGPQGRVLDMRKVLPGIVKHPEFPKDMLS